MSRELPAHPRWPDGSPMMLGQLTHHKSDEVPDDWRTGRITEICIVGLTARDDRELEVWIHTDAGGSLIIHAEDIELMK